MGAMDKLKQTNMADFHYDLPEDRIALFPKEKRDTSRLLVWEKGKISDSHYTHISRHLPTNAHLVFNNTKVIAARLSFFKSTGGAVEVFLLEPADGNYAALSDKGATVWKCLVGGLKKWKNNEVLETHCDVGAYPTKVKALLQEKKDDACIVKFMWEGPEAMFADIIATAGKIPLPPYIKRKSEEIDTDRYQTVYARKAGSVAAPTAGLHFTEGVFNDLKTKGIETSFITLHVGAGTFKPVTANSIADHLMHEEYFEVDREQLSKLGDASSMITAVGTTTLRTLESLYWMGVKIIQGKLSSNEELALSQWEHLELQTSALPSASESMQAILKWMNEHQKTTLSGHTGICITPGYTFRVAKALITNFHQPQSTLLLLIAAIMGDEWKKVYGHALQNGYRFLSYGDGSLLFIKGQEQQLN